MADDEEYAGEEGQHAGSDNEYIGDYTLVVRHSNELDGELIQFDAMTLVVASDCRNLTFRLIIGVAYILC